nr:alpha-aminoadipic semialdehyde synthase, mitochondrial [Ciona intestinalis]|eukprot:XP_018667627.1 alpha-aminoadipic semialdehyde synthase, mitochondrial [Ciona intestinalis]
MILKHLRQNIIKYSNVRYVNNSAPIVAIRREDNVVWERRAPLAPSHVRKLVHDGIKVLVQPANKRAFPVQEYVSVGATIQEDLSEASVILGVKQVPVDCLQADKTYIFFSHTIKAQDENMPMLDAILERNIRLIDYEMMAEANGMRVVAFGQYAGSAGMINILHGMGLRLLALGHHTPLMHIGIAHNYRTSGQAIQAVRDAGYEISLGRLPESIGPLTFVFTGTGNVSQGAQEVFKELPHVYVEPHELKNVAQHGDASVVYGCIVDMHDHLRRKSDGGFDMQEYFNKPQLYESVFAKEIAPYASCIMNGIFWRPQDPRLLTTPDAALLQDTTTSPKISPLVRRSNVSSEGCPRLPHRLIAIGDVSADPGGSVEFMKNCTSIDAPFVVYDGINNETQQGVKGPGILICSVDNLPAQLPRESTQFFGDQLFPYMKDIAHNVATSNYEDIHSMSPVVKNAIIASNGKLTPKFEYIQELRKKRMQAGAMYATSSQNHKVLVLGAGFVSAPLIDYLTKHNDTAVTVASNIKQEVKNMSGKFKHASPIVLDILKETDRLTELVKGHDLVISLLPHTIHPPIAKLCIENKKNFVTASYVSPQIKELEKSALDAGISIVMEVGVDPGIDHMLAMQCFHDIKERGGNVSSFVSWCGGLPSPEDSENPLKYKFSWSPAGMLQSAMAGSRYLKDGKVIEMAEGGDNYKYGRQDISFMPGFHLEGFPNRDSIKYKDQYEIQEADTVFRGTLRYDGFVDSIIGLQQLGIVSSEMNSMLDEDSPDISWKQFISHILGGGSDISEEDLQQLVYKCVDENDHRLQTIIGLGLLSENIVPKLKSPLQSLAAHLATKLTYGNDERDMIVLRHEVIGQFNKGKTEHHNIDLVVYGEPAGYTAMAATVGYPCAIAARMVLLNKIETKGVVTPLKKAVYKPLLKELKRLGIKPKISITTN